MINPMALDNQVVIVTGAGQGIGRGVAALSAELGAKVVVNDLNEDGVKETAEQIGGNARAIVGNVADPDFPGKLVKFAFDEFGDIAAEVTFSDLAAHIFFSETGVPIPQRAQSEFLGVHQGRAVYLLFDESSPQTPREAAGNVLTPDRLDRLPAPPEGFDGVRVIYAEGCTVSPDRLKVASAVFKQIPYQVEGV